MGYDSKGILVFNLKYEHAISFINLVKFIKLLSNATVNIIEIVRNGDHSPIFPPGGVAVPTVVRKTFVFR